VSQGPTPPDPGRPAPFDHEEPWPGEPGYEAPPAPEAESAPAEEPAPEPAAELAAEAELPAEPEPVAEPELAAEPEPVPDEPPYLAPPMTEEHAEGSLRIPVGYQTIEGLPLGSGRVVALAVSRFNGQVTSAMLDSALAELGRLGIGGDSIVIVPVPGAFELPLAAMALAKSRRFSCVVALGCVIRGETPHFEYIAAEAASGLQLAALETGVPVAFGVLTVDTLEQAEARVQKGAEAVRTALEMADVFGRLRTASAGG
jgi:6,7-dimethyl-8-ribityllumazine synthase